MIHQKHSVFDKNVTQHGKIYKEVFPWFEMYPEM